MLVFLLTLLSTGVLGERYSGGSYYLKSKCTSNSDCRGILKCDFGWAKTINGKKYGMCRDPNCKNAHGDEYCEEFGKGDYCHFDQHRQTYSELYGNDFDLGSALNSMCEKSCDPHCVGSVPLVLRRGDDGQRPGKLGEFCTHHLECDGTALCDYTQNTVKIVGYTMGVCRKSDCTEKYGFGPWYDCAEVREDPRVCGPDLNSRWEDCRVTCDPMCYGSPINTEFRSDLDKNGYGVDTSLVAFHEGGNSNMVLQAFAVFGFAVMVYGAGKHYTK